MFFPVYDALRTLLYQPNADLELLHHVAKYPNHHTSPYSIPHPYTSFFTFANQPYNPVSHRSINLKGSALNQLTLKAQQEKTPLRILKLVLVTPDCTLKTAEVFR